MSASAGSLRLLQKVLALCRRRGFVFHSPEMGGAREGAFEYGPLGTELKRNLSSEWWHAVVVSTGNVHALDTNTLVSPTAFDVSTTETQLQCDQTLPFRAKGMACETKANWRGLDNYPHEPEAEPQPSSESSHSVHLRSHLLHGGILHFLECARSQGLRIPFGIAEVGRVYRNEASPERFLFKRREFEQMVLQFFCSPSEDRQWLAYWQKRRLRWWKRFANHPECFSLAATAHSELHDSFLQHCSIQFNFPGSTSDVESITNRGDSDLRRLAELSEHLGSSLKRAKTESERTYPHVISTLAGADRGVLAYLCDAYTETWRPYGPKSDFRLNTVLKLHTCLAPYKVAVLPMQESNQKLCMYCRMLAEELRLAGVRTAYSDVGSFEYRLSVQDEIGTPYRIIADEGTLEMGIVALQDRDTTAQEDMNGQEVIHSIQRMLLGARLN